MENNIGIYKITSPKNKVYIGQTIDFKKRIKQYKNLNCKSQIRIYNSIKKYGSESHKFELIEVCESHLLNERERYWQDFYNCTCSMGLNCRLTFSFDKSGNLSEETKRKMRGRIISQEIRKKMSEAQKGRKLSQERIEQMRIISTGKCATEKSKKLTSDKLKGVSKSEITKQKMKHNSAKYWLGKKMSELTKEKMRISSGSARLVINLETGIYYDSCKKAAESTGNLIKGYLNKKLSGYNKNKTQFIYV